MTTEHVLFISGCFLALAGHAHAQNGRTVMGQVLNQNGTPIANATVEALGSYYQAFTTIDGRFALWLPFGEWDLIVHRLGYRPDTARVVVTLDKGSDLLRIQLERSPLSLQGISVEAARSPPMARTVTPRTIREVPPLGEPDVFRALVLLPLVNQPNDLKGRIHLAGGASDETGVRVDGHPIGQPFHALGLLGAFNIASLERANVLIHHVPPKWGGRLSGVIDLETRRTDGKTPASEAIASLLSTSYTTVRPDLPWEMELLVSARITYADKFIALLKGAGIIGEGTDIPLLGYRDALIRIGKRWNEDARLELLVLRTRDRFVDSNLSEIDGYEPLRWGESLIGIRFERSVGPWRVASRASFGRAGAWLDERAALGSDVIENNEDRVSATVRIARLWPNMRLSLGLGFDRWDYSHFWRAEGFVDELFGPWVPGNYRGGSERTATYAFGAFSGHIRPRLTLEMGVRLTMMDGVFHPAPRLRVSWRMRPDVSVHASINRRFQFDAIAAEPGPGSIRPPLFLLTKPRKVDQAALTLEWASQDLPLGARGTIRMDAFFKRYPNRTILERQAATVRSDTFPMFRRVRGRVGGASLNARLRWHGGWLVQGGYIYQRAMEKFDGYWTPTAWDSPHTFTIFVNAPIFDSWDVNIAFRTHTGPAVTPVTIRTFAPRPDGDLRFLLPRFLEGSRNSIRTPPYRRLDIGIRHEFPAWNADWTLFLQALNILFHRNPTGYNWETYFNDVRLAQNNPGFEPRPGQSGLPILPSIGVEVRW